ncbi:MAG TPA: hypothetical protein VNF02_04685 [Candidatus Limnocylindrales bacterium]|nr:hypothetical protein [Candidatus Limnocylindrales bacterium]
MKNAEKLERATDKLHGIIKEHLSKFPAEDQERRWAALKRYVSGAASDKSAKPQGRRARQASHRRSPVRVTHR